MNLNHDLISLAALTAGLVAALLTMVLGAFAQKNALEEVHRIISELPTTFLSNDPIMRPQQRFYAAVEFGCLYLLRILPSLVLIVGGFVLLWRVNSYLFQFLAFPTL